MAGMPCTQADYDALLAARKACILKVQYQDKVITYASIEDQDRTLAQMKQYLAPTERCSLAEFSRD